MKTFEALVSRSTLVEFTQNRSFNDGEEAREIDELLIVNTVSDDAQQEPDYYEEDPIDGKPLVVRVNRWASTLDQWTNYTFRRVWQDVYHVQFENYPCEELSNEEVFRDNGLVPLEDEEVETMLGRFDGGSPLKKARLILEARGIAEKAREKPTVKLGISLTYAGETDEAGNLISPIDPEIITATLYSVASGEWSFYLRSQEPISEFTEVGMYDAILELESARLLVRVWVVPANN